tara:strand:- start:23 stop:556 length:534 start_codon:yes stop_codon:yes gene_type:complete
VTFNEVTLGFGQPAGLIRRRTRAWTVRYLDPATGAPLPADDPRSQAFLHKSFPEAQAVPEVSWSVDGSAGAFNLGLALFFTFVSWAWWVGLRANAQSRPALRLSILGYAIWPALVGFAIGLSLLDQHGLKPATLIVIPFDLAFAGTVYFLSVLTTLGLAVRFGRQPEASAEPVVPTS